MLRLLALLAGLVLAALFFLTRRGAHEAGTPVPLRVTSEVQAQESAQPPLDLVPEADDSRQGGGALAFPRVIGQVRFEGNLADLEGSLVALTFEDYHDSALALEEAHLRAAGEAPGQLPRPSLRTTHLRRDGWWAVDLPGRSWVLAAEIEPAKRSIRSTVEPSVTWRAAIRSRARIDRPLESGKLQMVLDVDPGLSARGLVLDATTQAPVARAQVQLLTQHGPLMCLTDERGAFCLTGIDPCELLPTDGCIVFHLQAAQYVDLERKTAWEEGQEGIVAFRAYLQKKMPGVR